MRNTGIVRRLDDLGRLTIPKELRKLNNIEINDAVEIYTQADMIVLKKYSPGCNFCKNINFIEVSGIKICKDCIAKIKKIKNED